MFAVVILSWSRCHFGTGSSVASLWEIFSVVSQKVVNCWYGEMCTTYKNWNIKPKDLEVDPCLLVSKPSIKVISVVQKILLGLPVGKCWCPHMTDSITNYVHSNATTDDDDDNTLQVQPEKTRRFGKSGRHLNRKTEKEHHQQKYSIQCWVAKKQTTWARKEGRPLTPSWSGQTHRKRWTSEWSVLLLLLGLTS